MKKRSILSDFHDDKGCGYCQRRAGSFHLYGCELEECPFCHLQLIGCDCCYKQLGVDSHKEPVYSEGLNNRQTLQWRSILRKKGRIPIGGETMGDFYRMLSADPAVVAVQKSEGTTFAVRAPIMGYTTIEGLSEEEARDLIILCEIYRLLGRSYDLHSSKRSPKFDTGQALDKLTDFSFPLGTANSKTMFRGLPDQVVKRKKKMLTVLHRNLMKRIRTKLSFIMRHQKKLDSFLVLPF